MAEPTEAPPQGDLSRELLTELHGFFALEAPFLVRDLPRVATEEKLEAAHRFLPRLLRLEVL